MSALLPQHDRKKKPRSSKLRLGRISIRNHIYLVSFCTRNRQRLFDDLWLARIVVRRINSCVGVNTLAFVVMPDHVHWLLQLTGERPLSRVIQSLKIVTAKSINHARQAKGSVWQAGFHDCAARKEQNIRSMARYLVANPVRAGLVRSVKDYPHWDAIWM